MAKRKPKPRRAVAGATPPTVASCNPADTLQLRTLFWHHVVREMLTTLSVMQQMSPAERKKAGVEDAARSDGSIAVLTHAGERIPIAEVFPMFACGIPGTSSEQAVSIAVECTVFRVRTPDGEVFTLPLHEIRGLHSLTSDLIRQIERESMAPSGDADQAFGFAAFTSLAKGAGKP